METKRIKCPECSTVMDVTNKSHETVKHIKCPQCGAALAVSFDTFGADPETVYSAGKKRKGGKPAIVYNGKRYALSAGDNIIGRKAQNSDTPVQIDTAGSADGKTMSRKHLKICVKELPDERYKSIASTYKAKNPTFVNGETLGETDRIVLYDGDKIKMGKVVVTFAGGTATDGDMIVNM